MTATEVQAQNEPTVLPIVLPIVLNDGQYGGFPSPADDYLHRPLDLNERLTPHPTTTFFIEVTGNSMAAYKIFDGDVLIIDRAEDCHDGHLVLAVIESQFALRRLRKFEGKFWLCPSEPDQPSIELDESCEIWGRVMWSLTRH